MTMDMEKLGSQSYYNAQQNTANRLGVQYAPNAKGAPYLGGQGLSGPNLQSAARWANDKSANRPWETNAESQADTRNNFYYGGQANGANNFVAAKGAEAAGLAGDFGQTQNVAGSIDSQARTLGDASQALGDKLAVRAGKATAQQAQVNARAPGQFLDQGSIGDNSIDRQRQVGAYNALNQFASQGPGPSAAQGQLNQATDANMRDALALARSGRGMGQSQAALRQAIGQNAITGQQAANQSAVLTAQENQAYQNARLAAMQGMGGIAGAARQGDVAAGSYFTGSQQAAQNANDQAALGYGGLNRDYGAQELGAMQQQQAANQQRIAAGQLGLGAQQANAQTQLGYSNLENGINTANFNGAQNYEQNLQNYYQGYQQSQAQNKGTDYTPYVQAGAAVLAAAV